MLVWNIKAFSQRVYRTRYDIGIMTPNFLFLSSIPGSQKGNWLASPRMNCAVDEENYPLR